MAPPNRRRLDHFITSVASLRLRDQDTVHTRLPIHGLTAPKPQVDRKGVRKPTLPVRPSSPNLFNLANPLPIPYRPDHTSGMKCAVNSSSNVTMCRDLTTIRQHALHPRRRGAENRFQPMLAVESPLSLNAMLSFAARDSLFRFKGRKGRKGRQGSTRVDKGSFKGCDAEHAFQGCPRFAGDGGVWSTGTSTAYRVKNPALAVYSTENAQHAE